MKVEITDGWGIQCEEQMKYNEPYKKQQRLS